MRTETIEINDNLFELQHPGNRQWVKLQSKLVGKGDELNIEALLDYCFEHVVFPAQGPKLCLDENDPDAKNKRPVPLDELEVWQNVLPSFLRGELEPSFVWPKDKPRKVTGNSGDKGNHGAGPKKQGAK